MANRARKFATILTAILASMLFSHVFIARAGNNNMYPVAAEVGRIAVYLDENSVQPGQDAILVTKNSNGSFTNQGSACPVSPDEAARWLGVEANEMTLVDTGFEKYWAFKSSNGKAKPIRVPFGSFQDYRGTWTSWSQINADSGTWRCAKAQTPNIKTEAPVVDRPCPVFAGVQTTRLDDGANCKLQKQPKAVTGTVPGGWTADFWDDSQHGVRTGVPAGTTITTDEATFKPLK